MILRDANTVESKFSIADSPFDLSFISLSISIRSNCFDLSNHVKSIYFLTSGTNGAAIF